MNRSLLGYSSLWKGLACVAVLAISVASGWADDTLGTFKIGTQTTITLDGQAATADQLKAGMRAYVQPDSFQEGYALSIDAQTGKAPADTAKPKTAAPADKSKPAPAAPKALNPTITSVSSGSVTVAMQ